jgi:hypothetical protein
MFTISTLRRAAATALLGTAALAGSAPSLAAATWTSDYAAFIAANTALAVEDFESANLPAGSDTAFAGPLNASTNNGVFATGSVLPGFSIRGWEGGDIYASRDFGGNSGANVSSNLFAEDIFIEFGAGITAVGLDLLQWQGNDDGWLISIVDSSLNLISEIAVSSAAFVGVTSSTSIAGVYLGKPNTGGVIDNLHFGVAGGGTVPAPTSLLLAGAALLALRLSSRPASPARRG